MRADRPDDARECLPRADDSEPGLRAALAVEQCDDCLRWLAAERMDAFNTWIWDGLELLQADPALLAELSPGLERAIDQAAAALALHARAAERFGAALSGDPAHDRGLWSEQAWAWAQAGQVDRALAVLDGAIAAYPEEFTYYWAHAQVLLGAKRFHEAEVSARAALDQAYGDQRLRAALLLGEILEAAGRPAEALAAVDAALSEAPRPAEDLAVRTWRYLGQLEELRLRLEPVPAEQ